MQEVLMVCRDVSIYRADAVLDARPNPIYSVSVDDKPGVQAIGLIAPDLPPVPGKAPTVGRDYEDGRRGTVSILAGTDLHSGHIFANVEDLHRSVEFIALLKRLDEYCPSEANRRVVLNNHSAHISKATVAYLGTRPGRFEYGHTPKHGSWLNLIECAFSKMARTFLRHIRVESIDELKARPADRENGFDELKNQLGRSGFTPQDISRCQTTARAGVLVCNWWSWYCRAASPGARTKAIASRPMLLAAVGKAASHAGQTTLYLTLMHGKAKLLKSMIANIRAALLHIKAIAEQCVPSASLHELNPQPR